MDTLEHASTAETGLGSANQGIGDAYKLCGGHRHTRLGGAAAAVSSSVVDCAVVFVSSARHAAVRDALNGRRLQTLFL